MNINNTDDMWDYLVENDIASTETLEVITSINGMSMDTLEDVLFAVTGYRSVDQLEDEE